MDGSSSPSASSSEDDTSGRSDRQASRSRTQQDDEPGAEDAAESDSDGSEAAPPARPRSGLEVDDRPPEPGTDDGDGHSGVRRRGGSGTIEGDGHQEQNGDGAADDGESDEEDDEEDDEEEEEEEPTLKYSRLEGSTAQIFARDTASAIVVCEKYIVSPPDMALSPRRC